MSLCQTKQWFQSIVDFYCDAYEVANIVYSFRIQFLLGANLWLDSFTIDSAHDLDAYDKKRHLIRIKPTILVSGVWSILWLIMTYCSYTRWFMYRSYNYKSLLLGYLSIYQFLFCSVFLSASVSVCPSVCLSLSLSLSFSIYIYHFFFLYILVYAYLSHYINRYLSIYLLPQEMSRKGMVS